MKRKTNLITIIFFLLFLGITIVLALPNKTKETKPATNSKLVINKDKNEKITEKFTLFIPSLNISAPVVLNVDGSNKEAYFKALESGVAHLKGSAKPGENSNTFIFGHSSFYQDAKGNYKEIFKTLNNLNIGDLIEVKSQIKTYKYQVTEKKIVDPNEIDVLKPTPTEQLTLMTCYPPGTAEKRLIVIAK